MAPQVTAVVPAPRQAPQRDPVEGGRRGVVVQDGRGEFAAEVPDIAGGPPLLGREAGDPKGIDGVGLRTLQIGCRTRRDQGL
jgi:hypothetical protein